MKKKGDLSSLRKEFLQSGINKEDLKSSPVEQFSLWFSQAMESDIVEPTCDEPGNLRRFYWNKDGAS